MGDVAQRVIYFNQVADFDRAFKEENKPGDKIVCDGLQTKPNADREGAGNDDEVLKFYAKGEGGQKNGGDEADVPKDSGDGILHAFVEPGLRQQIVSKDTLGKPEQDPDD